MSSVVTVMAWMPALAGQSAAADALWRLNVSPYTLHFRPKPEHQDVYAIGLERQRADSWLHGASFFRNSFGQPSGFVYLGQRHGLAAGALPMYVQWSGGVLYGYKGEFEDKIPFNHNGFAPGLLLSAGWTLAPRTAVQVNLLGDAGLMLQLSYDLR